MITYKIKKDENGVEQCILRSDGWSIPFAEDNTDYQAYLAWVAEGNEPSPPDEAVSE